MKQVKIHTSALSKEELQKIILNWASQEPPRKRETFLDQLNPEGNIGSSRYDRKELINEIDRFAERVKDGDYCDGYGWDNEIYEERDFGDESWAEEMDDFLLEARGMLMEGYSKIAEEAYRKLFQILEMGEEPGHLPGDLDPRTMLEVDLGEHVALFFRSAYLNASSEVRVNLLYEAMNEYGYLVLPRIKLLDVRDSLDAPLPGFHGFLEDWIEFLKEHIPSFHVSELLREAVFLKGGVPAIAEFARAHVKKYPTAYMDWITALEQDGDPKAVLQVAIEGLSKIPRDYVVRANVAEKLIEIGEERNDNKLRLKGLRESFYSNPSMKYLLDLYMIAEEEGCFDEIKNEVLKRMKELKAEGRTNNDTYCDIERRLSDFYEGVFIHALLLSGCYEDVFQMCKGKGPLGWSPSAHPKPVMLIFLMDILSKEDKYSKVLNDQWRYAVIRGYDTQEINIEKYQKIITRVKSTIHLTEEQEAVYLKWCKRETGRRIDAIVSNQYRGSYDKAAKILVAMAETLANRENKQEGLAFVEKYRNKYPRYSAFRREINEALRASGL